jgi:hypothetical protein
MYTLITLSWCVCRLKKINLVTPPGMTKTDVEQIGSNRGVGVQWTPTVHQYGQRVLFQGSGREQVENASYIKIHTLS